jgi:ribosomal protein S18 acetylase RimI-like enzyme
MLAAVPTPATVTLRDLDPDDLPAARRIIATAFAGEPFAVGMFGESRLDRLIGMIGDYRAWPWAADPIVVVAEAGGAVIGSASATLPGACHPCDDFDPVVAPDATQAQRIEHEFQSRCRAAHLDSDLPPHAHITTVAIDPFLQGSGVGGRLVRELIDRIWATDTACAVLECLTARESFYSRSGFRSIAEFDDPGGPDLRAVLMRIDRA